MIPSVNLACYGVSHVKKDLQCGDCATVELQWLKHLQGYENMFETGVFGTNEC